MRKKYEDLKINRIEALIFYKFFVKKFHYYCVMKSALILLLLFFGLSAVHSQNTSTHAYYLSSELHLINFFGGEIALNYIHNEKTSARIAYSGVVTGAQSEPQDFSSGLIGSLFLGLADPKDQMGTFHLGIGRIVPLNRKATTRFNFNLGLGLSTLQVPHNWEPLKGGTGLNYSWDTKKYNTLSLIINPILEFPITRFIGFNLSPLLLINKDRTYVGIGIGTMLGKLRERKK